MIAAIWQAQYRAMRFFGRGSVFGMIAGAIWYRAHHPGQSVVGGNGNAGTAGAGCILAIFIGDVGRAIGRNANVSMQSAASSGRHGKVHAVDRGEGINRDTRAKGYAAIVAA